MLKKIIIILEFALCSMLLSISVHAQQNEAELFPITEDSKAKDGVLYGEFINGKLENSKVFPGTNRNVQIFVPSAYDGKTPACVCIFQDGGIGFNAHIVVSNLIASGEIPVMILIASGWGRLEGDVDSESIRANRTFEYDTPSSKYGEYVLTELLPYVETLKTKDGKPIILSKDGNDRMITGASSGAACAFNAAWCNPEEFPRAFTPIGSFTGLRGSYELSTLVHKMEPKNIRLYLQSGENDMWTCFGDWWSANQSMARALEFAGYDFKYAFGKGSHSGVHANMIFPEVMRYMWKDYPQEIKATGKTRNHVLSFVLKENEKFEEVTKLEGAISLVSYGNEDVFVFGKDKSVVIDKDGKFLNKDFTDRVFATSPNNIMFVSAPNKEAFIAESIIAEGSAIRKLSEKIYPSNAVALRNGNFFVMGAKSPNENPSYLWLVEKNGNVIECDSNIKGARALTVSANENWLYTFEYDTRRGFSYKISKEDNELKYKQEFFFIHVPEEADSAETSSAICDEHGYTYLATSFGIQVCDNNGRSAAIIPLPKNVKPISIAWGGEDMKTLFVLGENGVVYKRKVNAKGASIFHEIPKIRQGAG